jgi:hypothetical protein
MVRLKSLLEQGQTSADQGLVRLHEISSAGTSGATTR